MKSRQQETGHVSSVASHDTPAHGRLPYVLVNMSMTADGKIATANRAVSSFGSRRDFRHLLELRLFRDIPILSPAAYLSRPTQSD